MFSSSVFLSPLPPQSMNLSPKHVLGLELYQHLQTSLPSTEQSLSLDPSLLGLPAYQNLPLLELLYTAC